MGFIVGDKASCRETEDMADLRRVAESFKTREVDVLAISGGDGTNHCTLTTFLQVYGEKPLPKIAFLKGGTLNTVATGLGIKGTPEKILSDVVIKYHEDIPFSTRQVTLTKINDSYGFIFGIGLIYNFMEAYYRDGIPSPAKAAVTLVRAIGSALFNTKFACDMFRRFDARVMINGQVWPYRNYSAIYTGSINQIGLNFRTFYLAEQVPEHFHAIGFSLPPRNVLPYVPKMYLGKPSGCPNLLEEAATEMVIELDTPLPHQIDGDMRGAEKVYRISTGPTLTVVIP
jgi:diacylglycerol kinase family enzyme